MRRFSILLLILLTCLVAAPLRLTAQQLPHYTVTDLGTLGGTFSFAEGISNTGWVEGYATLPGDQVYRAFVWRKGVKTGIGTFGGPDSLIGWSHPSDSGGASGDAETTLQDPYNDYWCVANYTCLPFLWQHGVLTQLPTPGGYNGQSHGMNNWGEVVGFVENTTLDVSCENLGYLTQEPEAVLWKNGRIYELPPYSGDEAGSARRINDWGQAVGWSYIGCTDFTHALLWQDGTPINLGTLGGVLNNQATDINDLGQVVGYSDLSGDATGDAFLWQWGAMTDLGTLSGDFGSEGIGINNQTQVVGGSWDVNGNERAFFWQEGVMTDLNTLIPASSPLYLIEADDINDQGQIVGGGVTSTGELHAFLASPSRWGAVGGAATSTAPKQRPNVSLPENLRRLLQRRLPFGGSQGGPVRP